jgi:hypothetical protein
VYSKDKIGSCKYSGSESKAERGIAWVNVMSQSVLPEIVRGYEYFFKQ